MKEETFNQPNEELHLPNKEISQSHYSVPKGYFESLEGNIMQAIDREISQSIHTPPASLWTKIKPSLYLAATFVSVYLSFKLLAPSTNQDLAGTTAKVAQVETSDEDYKIYYESYASELASQEAAEELLALMQ